MKVTMFKCDECGALHEEADRKPFAEREYVAVSNALHFCKKCAKVVTVYDAIYRMAVKFKEV